MKQNAFKIASKILLKQQIISNMNIAQTCLNDKDKENDKVKNKEKEEEKNKEKNNVKEKESCRILSEREDYIVSLFENFYSTIPVKQISLEKFLLTSKFKVQVEDYRKCSDSAKRKSMKGNLWCVTPSGTFSQRGESYLIKHTGLLCIDVDSKDNPMIDLRQSKKIIGAYCPYLYYAGLSVSGEGIFLLFRISNPELHKQHFGALAELLYRKFGLQVDKAVKSPASLRVASYDDDPYYNPNAQPFKYVMETNKRSGHPVRTSKQKNNLMKRVEKVISIIKEKRIDVTKQYTNWFKIGCALAYEFGEDGRYWFHVISRMYENYNEGDCDIQYSRCLKYKKDDGVKIGTFFFLCKQCGISV